MYQFQDSAMKYLTECLQTFKDACHHIEVISNKNSGFLRTDYNVARKYEPHEYYYFRFLTLECYIARLSHSSNYAICCMNFRPKGLELTSRDKGDINFYKNCYGFFESLDNAIDVWKGCIVQSLNYVPQLEIF